MRRVNLRKSFLEDTTLELCLKKKKDSPEKNTVRVIERIAFR